MISNKKILVFLFSIVLATVQAQKFEIQKVTVADLQQKFHPSDSAAAAAILYQIGDCNFDYNQQTGFTIRTKVKTRIKIYKKEGYEWANHSESYYSASNAKEVVSFSNAYSYNLVDGKVEKTKLKSDGEFDEDINKYWSRKKITMPNVKEGSIIEFEYSISSPNETSIQDWDFQTSIPVNYSEWVVGIPEFYTFVPNQRGYIFPKTSKEAVQKSVMLTSKEASGNRYTQHNIISTDKIDYVENRTTYIAQDLPALRDEAFVNNIRNYTSSISHALAAIKWKNSLPKYFSSDWESVTKTIYESDSFGPELNKTGYFEDDIKVLIAAATTPEEKIAVIFNHVKASVNWNKFDGYWCMDGVRKAYKEKTGNVAEINLMLTAMLRYAGLTANPVLLSTRSNGVAMFPNTSAYNYVVASVEIGNGVILLDATEKYSLPNVLPLRDLNWTGRLIRKDGTSSQIDLMPQRASKESINVLYTVDKEGGITGKYRKQLTDHIALSYRQRNIGVVNDQYLETLENKNDKIEISDYVRENEQDLAKPIVESYNFKLNSAHEVIGDKIYISPLLFLSTKNNPFKQEKREYPIDFGYPTETKYNFNIELPEGYVVESMPQTLNLATEEKMGTFKYMIVNNGNKVQITITTNFNQAIIAPTSYLTIKDFFQKIVDKENEKIVLKKA